MKRIITLIAASLLLSPIALTAQQIDNTLSFKNLNTDSYFRISYDNDYFSATDQYYTQGFSFELAAPWVKKFPLSKTLLTLVPGNTKYGIGIEHNGYTPKSISSDAILYGDRPFCADISLKSFAITIDSVHKQRFATTLSAGVIGPAAGGGEMQKFIHENTHNIIPHGWEHQIQNDLMLNYQADYQKEIVSYKNIFSLSADAVARIGTVNDKAGVGATMLIGYFDSPFMPDISKDAAHHRFRIFAYEHPMVNAVGYDATLQGGLFNRSSPYTIDAKDIQRLTFENRFGFVITYQRLYLEYFQSVLSNEFTNSQMHVWGGVQVAFGL